MLHLLGLRSHNTIDRDWPVDCYRCEAGEPARRGCAAASSPPGAGERGGMSEVTISLDGHAEELAVFGSRDQYLRQVRDAVGVKVLARHGEVRIDGDADRVEQARRIFEGLRSIFRARKTISSSDVSELIDETLQRGGARTGRIGRDSRRQPRGAAALGGPVALSGGAASRTSWCSASARRVPARPIWRWRPPCRFLRRGRIKKIVLVRPAVEAGEHLGFLPGDLEAKINPYLRPLLDALHDLMEYDQIRRYMDNDLIEIAPAGLHAGPDPERRSHHSRRRAERDRAADEDVPDAHGPKRADRRDGRRHASRPAARHEERAGRRGRALASRLPGWRRSCSIARTSCAIRSCRKSSTPTRPASASSERRGRPTSPAAGAILESRPTGAAGSAAIVLLLSTGRASTRSASGAQRKPRGEHPPSP